MREVISHKIEVHVAGICIHDNKVLIAKRSPNRKLYPSLWECGGGQVEAGESFEEAVIRQIREEFSAIVKPIKVLGTYEISKADLEQKKIPGIKFVCRIEGFVNGTEPIISDEHTEWRWQPVEKLNEVEYIPGVVEDIRLVIDA